MESSNRLQSRQTRTKNNRWGFSTWRLIFALALFTSACGSADDRSAYLPGNTGNMGEIIVVAPESFWESPASKPFSKQCLEILPGLPAPEPMFSCVKVKETGFDDIFKTHRNVLQITVDPEKPTQIVSKKDLYSRQQLYVLVNIQHTSDSNAVTKGELEQLWWLFHKAEIERLVSRNREFGSAVLNQTIAEHTGLDIVMQQDFIIAKKDTHFIWLRLDREKPVGGYQHQINQGIMIYSRPYKDTNQFSDSSLFAWKNQINGKYIEGPAGSHMAISTKLYLPQTYFITFRGYAAKEIRGLWRMDGVDGVFMGGPFYALSFVNVYNGRQYMIDGYVYGPQFDKLPFVREIEAIAKSVKPVQDKEEAQ